MTDANRSQIKFERIVTSAQEEHMLKWSTFTTLTRLLCNHSSLHNEPSQKFGVLHECLKAELTEKKTNPKQTRKSSPRSLTNPTQIQILTPVFSLQLLWKRQNIAHFPLPFHPVLLERLRKQDKPNQIIIILLISYSVAGEATQTRQTKSNHYYPINILFCCWRGYANKTNQIKSLLSY